MVAAGSITVAVRVRPPTAWEAARLPEPCYDTSIRGDGALSTPGRYTTPTAVLRDIVQIVDDRIITFDPDEKDQAKAFVERGFLPPGTKRYKDRRFMFDRVFGHEARQQEVYEGTSQPLLQGILDGYNATVFAYGATGCGKTHTISGTEDDPGIIYMTMADLFQRIEDRKDDYNVEVIVTFLEIYNEEIRDLLAEPGAPTPRGGLAIREDKSVKVVGLVELRPRSAEEVKQIVLLGNQRRTQSPTHANETSSRSHAVLQVHVTQAPRTAALVEQKVVATLSIIDLAGSERAAATTNMGQRMVEGANINKSLLALGNCINALCESGGAVRHIPYRNSKLTRLLKFSLGGNCKTVMIVCVAPTSNHFDDTHNTLIYAERATKIKTKVVTRNVVNVERHVGRYVEAINRLNSEIAELKDKLAGKRDAESEIARRKKAEAHAEVERSRNDLAARAEQTKQSIVDGATCTGKLSVANMKLAAIRSRLKQIAEHGTANTAALPGDLEAEKALLQALAQPEEQVVQPSSQINLRMNRSSNSNAMFDATLRAVSERKSEKLEDIHIDTIKLDARCRRAEMDRLKAESEQDVLKESVQDVAEVMVKLMGMLGRCTVLIGDAAKTLNTALDGGDGVLNPSVRKVANMLGGVKEKNDEAFKSLVGHSTEGYTMPPETPSMDMFSNYGTKFASKRISSGPAVLQHEPPKPVFVRRSSESPASPPRRAHRSPRKSMRSSIASQPYRKASDKDRRASRSIKSVQWKDEAGQGDLDDGGIKPVIPPLAVTIIPATPNLGAAQPSGSKAPAEPTSIPRSTSSMSLGSESEWEDEKTDESASFSASLPRSIRDLSASLSASTGPSTTRTSSLGSLPPRRTRPSRLDPGFLKGKARMSTLSSLAEADERSTSPTGPRGSNPLSDLSLNHTSNGDDSGSSENEQKGPETSLSARMRGLSIPKASKEQRVLGSPARRVPASPSKTSISSARRRSVIGPLSKDKHRRRSSMIPTLSPTAIASSSTSLTAPVPPRRVVVASPAKRLKRVSMSTKIGAVKLRPIAGLTANLSMSAADTSDTSFSKPPRPSWR
ncbi:hypothetical protein AX16_000260 [Volvariella volvacea WC 439]|nr:hypothetical protein AX16_000260 [Volvariella volvacea WC 439]